MNTKNNKTNYDFRGIDVWNEQRLINQQPNYIKKANIDGTIKYINKKQITVLEWANIVSMARKGTKEENVDGYLSFFLNNTYHIKDVERYTIVNKRYSNKKSANTHIEEVIVEFADCIALDITPKNKSIDMVVMIYKAGLIDSDRLYNCLKDYIAYLNYTFYRSQYTTESNVSSSYNSELGNIWLALDYLIKHYNNKVSGFITYCNKYYSGIAYRISNKKEYADHDNTKKQYASIADKGNQTDLSLSAEMESLVEQLDNTTKEVIVMWHIDGYTRKEISSKLGLSSGAVSNINRDGLETLRSLYKQYIEDGNKVGFNTFSYFSNNKVSTTTIDD